MLVWRSAIFLLTVSPAFIEEATFETPLVIDEAMMPYLSFNQANQACKVANRVREALIKESGRCGGSGLGCFL